MSTSRPSAEPRAVRVSVSDVDLTVVLQDGRKLSVPLSWYPRLHNASPEQRAKWRLIGEGEGIHWPEVDEDLSVEGLLKGVPAPGISKRGS